MGKRQSAPTPDLAAIWACLEDVADPEIPILSLIDLGIIRDVRLADNGVDVDVAPTYSGCPATEVIEQLVVDAVRANTGREVRVHRVLSSPWTTDWISDAGRRKLTDYGIAPPSGSAGKRSLLGEDRPAACPRCASTETTRVSEFGSTPCKASYKCDACLEPFEYFKCL